MRLVIGHWKRLMRNTLTDAGQTTHFTNRKEKTMEIISENVIDMTYARLVDDCPTNGHYYSVEVGEIMDQVLVWYPAEEKVELDGNRFTTKLDVAFKRFFETKKKILENYKKKGG